MKNILFFLCFVFVLASCSSKKNILYMQDIDIRSNYDYVYSDYKIKTDDILNITVKNQLTETQSYINSSSGGFTNNKESLLYNGYRVNKNGYINHPLVGKVLAAGKSIEEFNDHLANLVISSGVLTNPTIDVKILNSYFIAIGEFNNPGKHEFLKNNLNILEAIAMAGDLSINGVRDDIIIIREDSKGKNIINVDLTDSSFLKSDAYQIFSGDIIVVNPNLNKVKTAGIIGNSGTLVSLLSFLLTSIILITNN